MVVAESLCCGTPVVGFKAGGPETIAINEYSSFVEYGNLDVLKSEIYNFLNKSFDRKEISEKAIDKYSREAMTNKYLKYYERQKM